MTTPFETIYDMFLGKITDDMYLEWTKEDTERDLQNILIDALPVFEFPRFPLYDYDLDNKCFNSELTHEEINILAVLMYATWLQRQIASVEFIRMKYSGSDFKMTSQANHLGKLLDLKAEADKQNIHLQRLYKRRKLEGQEYQSNWSSILEKSVFDA